MTTYVHKMPKTIEAAVKYLQAADEVAALALGLAAEAREHVETLTRQRKAGFKVVGGTDAVGGAGA